MKKDENGLAIITAEDLSLVEGNSLNEKQLKHILQKTPAKYIKSRPAKGGGNWNYVSGGYIKKCLNLMFGWAWDFEIIDEQIMHGEVVVKGRLTCRSNGQSIIKMQYGNKDIAYKRKPVFDNNGNPVMVTNSYGKSYQKTEPSDEPLSIGNDLKAAATDALKKCAAEIGIASDIYNAEEFREVHLTIEEKEEPSEEMKRAKTFIKKAQSIKEVQNLEKTFESTGLELDEETQAMLDDKKQSLTKKTA